MIYKVMKKLPRSAREWGVRLFTALMVWGGVRIYGVVGTIDMQHAAGVPEMTTSALLLQIALSLCLILAGRLGRRLCLRAKRKSKAALAAFSAVLPR